MRGLFFICHVHRALCLLMSGTARRRWLWPAVVLLIGGAIAFWAARRETMRLSAIEQQVRDICRAIADGRDVTGTLNPDNATVERRTIQELRGVIHGPGALSIIRVRVTSGDSDRAGPTSTPATHTATIMIGEEKLLALRIRCDDATQPIVVLGYFKPPGR